ncbi:MAG TPA: S4 domain-containing protein, partial [Candidatus Acidoferrum sp.]
RQFSDRQVPDDAPVKTLSKDNYVASEQGKVYLSRALLQLGAAPSRAEAERLIKQGAVELDGTVIKDPRHEIDLKTPRRCLVRVGKKNIFYLDVK